MSQWGPSSWCGNEDLHLWKEYLTNNGDVKHVIPSTTNNVCIQHMHRIRDVVASRQCVVPVKTVNMDEALLAT